MNLTPIHDFRSCARCFTVFNIPHGAFGHGWEYRPEYSGYVCPRCMDEENDEEA